MGQLLFLKYLNDLEEDRAEEAALENKRYTYILEKPYRWESWAAPKSKDGKLDHNTAKTGDDLTDFVNRKLFPYLHALRKQLLESCSLHTIVDCSQVTFQGAGVKTVVLFFDKGTKTRKIW